MLVLGIVCTALAASLAEPAFTPAQGDALSCADIAMRDPFVLPVKKEGLYYLYGTCPTFGQKPFLCYTSKDLKTWSGPTSVLELPQNFWAARDFWAPEVHLWKGRYYLFATYAAHEGKIRRTHLSVADSPVGRFRPIGDRPQTPAGWMCLDGTLFVDDAGAPWMVFCHEWVQVQNGEICAMRLSEDLSKAVGEPQLLFKASAAPWVRDKTDKVTDGPFLYRTKTDTLLMIWSSFGKDGKYKVGLACSSSGKLEGPWEQQAKPLYEDDGGHAMLFKTFDDRLMMSLHTPNHHPSHPVFIPVRDEGNTLVLGMRN
jgi:beta-xylosidase